jgi:Na+/melibiose symporter-like transporter
MTVSVFPGILFLAVLACLMVYPIGRKLNLQIQDELAARRKTFAAAEPAPLTTSASPGFGGGRKSG